MADRAPLPVALSRRLASLAASPVAREVLSFVPDVARLLRDVLADERVSPTAKLEVGAAIAWLASPLDRLVEWVPVFGQMEDAAVVAFAIRRLSAAAGEDVLREHWRGSERGFAVVRTFATAGSLRPLRLASAAARHWDTLRDAFAPAADATPTGGARRGFGGAGARVVDGEVLARRTHRP